MSTAETQATFDPKALARFGPYEVVRYLAEGGMAWVYEARDPKFPARRLALKVLKAQAGSGELFHRFVAEAKLLAGVDHPNLVTIFDLARDRDTGLAYYTMTFVEGATFVRAEPVPWREAIGPFLGILDGLAELHDRGVIHRDIKPGNMLRKDDGRALLADLGIARDPDSSGLTQVGTVMGTPAYMPPEQAAGKAVDARADLFAIGMSIYRVVTGRTVYQELDGVDARSGQSILFHLAGCTSRGEELRFEFPDSVPQPLRSVISKACRFDPEARYSTARELRGALAALLEVSNPRASAGAAEAETLVSRPSVARIDPERVESIGGYAIEGFVAEGGMGWVFRARHPERPDECVALKALKPGIGSDAELVRFRAEAELLSGIDHPNLMGVHDTGVDEATGTSFYTMPFIDSPPLSERARVPVDEALKIVDGVLTALAELHRRGVVHRDVKPANILLREGGTPVLMDLGIARQTNQQTMTSTGMFLGTALYASPEQARGSKIGPESDVFAVGLLLYRLLAGHSAYASVPEIDLGNDTSILFHLAKLEHAGEELAIEMPKEVPPALRDLIARSCRYKPEERYSDAVSMRTALRQARRDPRKRQRAKGRPGWLVPAATAAALGGLDFGAAGVDWSSLQQRLLRSESGPAAEVVPTSLVAATPTTDAAETASATNEAAARRSAPTAPSIVARKPSEARVALDAKGPTRLAIEVDAADGNVLYAWRVDGRSVANVGPTFDYAGRRGAQVEVTVTNGRGESETAAWQLEAANRRPRLGLVPSVARVELEVGDSRRFAARASDPDGDPVDVEYRIGDRVVGQGTSYVFVADRPGEYRLIARAKDGRGGVTELERFVRVNGVAPGDDPFAFGAVPASPGDLEARAGDAGGSGGGGSGFGGPPPPGGFGGAPGGASGAAPGGNVGPPSDGGGMGGGAPRGGGGRGRGGRGGRR